MKKLMTIYLMAAMMLCVTTSVAGLVVGQDPLADPHDMSGAIWKQHYLGYPDEWKNEAPEPGNAGVHSYDPATGIVTIKNSPLENYTKYVWLHIVFPNGTSPANDLQLQGEEVDPALWATCNAAGVTPELIGASWETSPIGTLHIWQLWKFPQSVCEETINVSQFVDANHVPLCIEAKTACVPEPTTMLLLSLGGLFFTRIKQQR